MSYINLKPNIYNKKYFNHLTNYELVLKYYHVNVRLYHHTLIIFDFYFYIVRKLILNRVIVKKN